MAPQTARGSRRALPAPQHLSHPRIPSPSPPACRQSLACDALRVCAVLAHEVFAVTKEQAPAALAQAAQLLHDNGLLVRRVAG